jgi:hypothetical protein
MGTIILLPLLIGEEARGTSILSGEISRLNEVKKLRKRGGTSNTSLSLI